jgi:hypothetical protein
MSTVGGAAGNTVIPNQTLYSTGSGGDISAIAGLSDAASQFGYALASVFGASTTGVAQARATGRASTSSSATSNTSLYILLALVAVVVIFVVVDE